MNIVVRPDLGRDVGVGHAMRCLALSEELVRRGHRVSFVCSAREVPWVQERMRSVGVEVCDEPGPDELVPLFLRKEADAVVFDSYRLPTSVYAAARAAGLRTMAFVDGPLRGAEADLLVDQNLGAEDDSYDRAELDDKGMRRLAGLGYAVIRDDILRRRPAAPPFASRVGRPRVLAFFGGTDVAGAGPVMAAGLVRTGCAFDATFIAADAELRERFRAMPPLGADQHLDVIGPTQDLADLIVRADLVLCAGGTSLWETFTLGAAVGVLCLADNQQAAYARVLDTGAAVGLGDLDQVRAQPAATTRILSQLLLEPARRSSLARAAWGMVDGEGKARVVDALL